MAVQTVRNVLVAAGPVTALVAQRVYPLVKEQDVQTPAITLQRVTLTPVNALRTWANLDENIVQCDSWSTKYTEARAIAAAARSALAAANILMQSERDDYDPATQLYRVSQDYRVWI